VKERRRTDKKEWKRNASHSRYPPLSSNEDHPEYVIELLMLGSAPPPGLGGGVVGVRGGGRIGSKGRSGGKRVGE
jgi:hypothetical protein